MAGTFFYVIDIFLHVRNQIHHDESIKHLFNKKKCSVNSKISKNGRMVEYKGYFNVVDLTGCEEKCVREWRAVSPPKREVASSDASDDVNKDDTNSAENDAVQDDAVAEDVVPNVDSSCSSDSLDHATATNNADSVDEDSGDDSSDLSVANVKDDKDYIRVVAYDIGERNLGYCVGEVPKASATGPRERRRVKILAIGLSDSKTKCSTARLSVRAARLAADAAEQAVGDGIPVDCVVVERQFELNRRASMIEAAMIAIYDTAARMKERHIILQDAPPQQVAKAFCMKHGYSRKKHDAIIIADALMADPTITEDNRSLANRAQYDPQLYRKRAKTVPQDEDADQVDFDKRALQTATAAMVGKQRVSNRSQDGNRRHDMADALLLLYWFAGRASEFVNRTHRTQASRGPFGKLTCPRFKRTFRHVKS